MSAKKRKPAKAKSETVIKFKTRPSPFKEGKGGGGYFGVVIPNGTATQDDVFEMMAKSGCTMGKHEIELVWNATWNVVLDEMIREPRVMDLGFCKLRPAIKGTFSHMDGKFDPKRNRLVVEVEPPESIRRALEKGVKAVNVTPVDVPPPRIDNVCQAPDYVRNTISAAAPFEILGVALTTECGDETAELSLPSGGRVPLSLKPQTRSDGSRRVKAQLAEPMPSPCPKRATLVLRTHGLEGAKSPLVTVKSASLKIVR